MKRTMEERLEAEKKEKEKKDLQKNSKEIYKNKNLHKGK